MASYHSYSASGPISRLRRLKVMLAEAEGPD
jgi:hypothetical protein